MSALDAVGIAGWMVVACWWGWWAHGWFLRRGLSAHTIYLKPGQRVSITNNEGDPEVDAWATMAAGARRSWTTENPYDTGNSAPPDPHNGGAT